MKGSNAQHAEQLESVIVEVLKAISSVSLRRQLFEAILEGARNLYPREVILLLRGRKGKSLIEITDLVVPPLANYGRGFADIRLHMMPMDFSIIGTVHSHPSGNLTPSSIDLNHFIGVVLMITAYPFKDEKNIAIYNRDGEKLILQITEA
jgi:proteasome lid subunit RPN8/RPN11